MDLCKVDVVELGLRSNPEQCNLPSFETTTDSFLENFDLPTDLDYAVMLNAKEFFGMTSDEINFEINQRFKKAELSPISIVRVAVNFDDALKTKTILNELRSLGYTLGLNLMQSNGKSSESYKELA